MFRNLLYFEWYYQTRNPFFYITFVFFFALGFFAAAAGNFSFPGMHRNSPYMITDVEGLLSLASIFSVTLMVAKTYLRESDTKMDALVYASPVSKRHYLGSRFMGAYLISALSYLMAVLGMMAGHMMPWLATDDMGPFSLWDYIWPFLILGLPNVLLCTALLSGIAWLTRNRLLIFVGGLLVFILYMVGSVISNSPLLAGASPASPAAMAMAAKADPFGMAAFFEQTRYWSALERNTTGIALTGNFLFNRLLWILISFISIAVPYRLFSFRKMKAVHIKKAVPPLPIVPARGYKTVAPRLHSLKNTLQVIGSFIRIDVALIVKGIPFLLILVILSGVLGVELLNAVDGGTRMAESLATTGLTVTTIMEILPFFTIMVLLFYSNELFRHSTSARIEMIEKASPVDPRNIFLSKCISLSVIPLVLVTCAIGIGTAFQVFNDNASVNAGLYLSLYYYIGLPMMLTAILVMAIQAFLKNGYTALTLSAAVLLLFSTGAGRIIGITNPLLRFGETIRIAYSEMNGFGNYAYFFHIRMLYNTGAALFLAILACRFWATGRIFLGSGRRESYFLIMAAVLFCGAGTYIFLQLNSASYMSGDDRLEWKVAYEQQFRKYEKLPQLTITDVKTAIDLFPDAQRYTVKGEYQLVNNTGRPLDSLLIYMDKNAQLESIEIRGAKRIAAPGFGHFWYRTDHPIKAGDSIAMRFSFRSCWKPFVDHTPFNSIIDNGSFIRISNYFPRFGYQPGNETGNKKERDARHLGRQTPITALEDKAVPFQYDFINLDAVVSTKAGQTAVGSGDLVASWQSEGRAYFHYKTPSPIPFRFALSSARYKLRHENYHGIEIQVLYAPGHDRNVEGLVSDIKKTLDCCGQNFGKYPFKAIRYAEISSFAEGFAATAYPEVIYMKENLGFNSDVSKGNKEDVINQLAGHELSHQWWATQLSPEQKEGGWLLTETLAQYTELMLYERAHGRDAALDIVKTHLDLYLGSRSFSEERPLYKTHYDTPHLPYNKGMVVMHELRQLLGEKTVNRALRSLIAHYAFPQQPADAQDLLNVFYKVAPESARPKIRALFTKIITYSSKADKAVAKRVSGRYQVSFSAHSLKFDENGKGGRTLIANDSTIDIGIYGRNGKLSLFTASIKNNIISGAITIPEEPVRLVLDPLLKNIDTFPVDNEIEIVQYR